MLLNIVTKTKEYSEVLENEKTESLSIGMTFINNLPSALKDSVIAFLPLILIFVFVCVFSSSSSKSEIRRMIFGFLYAIIGISVFFVGVNTGFMEVGINIGSYLVTLDSSNYLIIVGFVLGVVTILAEPAVYVLTHQIEEVTAGYVKRRSVLIALSLGVGLAIALSMLRIVVTEIQLWHYLLPGYLIALGLTSIVPKLFVGIAFDAR